MLPKRQLGGVATKFIDRIIEYEYIDIILILLNVGLNINCLKLRLCTSSCLHDLIALAITWGSQLASARLLDPISSTMISGHLALFALRSYRRSFSTVLPPIPNLETRHTSFRSNYFANCDYVNPSTFFPDRDKKPFV